jgi:hypothetical protein
MLWVSGRNVILFATPDQSTPRDVYPGRLGRNRPAVSQIVSMDVESAAVHTYTLCASIREFARKALEDFHEACADLPSLTITLKQNVGLPSRNR